MAAGANRLAGAKRLTGVGTAVMGGWDTDCNGATVGSILGVMLGAENVPAHWAVPLNDEIESYMPGQNGRSISDLAQDIHEMVSRLP